MRLRLLEGFTRSRTHKVTRVVTHAFGSIVVEHHRALALTHCLPKRCHHTLTVLVADNEAIDDHINGVYLISIELHSRRYLAHLTVDTGIDITLA